MNDREDKKTAHHRVINKEGEKGVIEEVSWERPRRKFSIFIYLTLCPLHPPPSPHVGHNSVHSHQKYLKNPL